ncbi:polysaccharide biosynthesis protein [Pseudarthrobacter phenanthrenivorans]|uniref:polysaccharide biosynthesis protein n=1 Tax=Pseudarthrobacter phenanthrenivorans TaxID=361575 RepID=UPI00112BFB2B|nr:polysaccharide biosynthesis protein [Pseudarthrobacter phenanthrenivorans]TPV52179.1 polysaccharide biosynthesis protein [Pseudarthrobacter phenanthrenivorans]
MKPVLLRLAGFTFLPLLVLALPLLLLPIVARVAGPSGWSSITAGQAIGVLAATVILWSWNVSGPVEIARCRTTAERAGVYSKSIRSRLLIAVVVLPLMTALVSVVAHDGYGLDAVTMAWATAMTGFSPSWYGIGTGQPRILAVFDALPRFLAAVISATLILATGQIWIYGVASTLATVASLISFHRRFGERGTWFPKDLRGVFQENLAQASVAGTNITGSAYASSPVPVATSTVSSAAATAGFASADSIYRFGIFTIVALGNTFQGWTLEADASSPRRRHIVACMSHAALGAAGGLGLALLGPWASELLFGDSVKADSLTSIFYGLSFFFLSVSTPLIRNILIPAKRQKTVLMWTAICAVAGLFLMTTAGLQSNVPGVALGMAVSEMLLFFGLLGPAWKLLPSVDTAPRRSLASSA